MMENEILCDTLNTSSEGEEEKKEEAAVNTLQNSTSSPDSLRDENDASIAWRTSQAVEEVTVPLPSMSDSASEEVKQFLDCFVLAGLIIVFSKRSAMK